jgi:uncharacterized membrane protein YphA (DoxX/SURF4 family)
MNSKENSNSALRFVLTCTRVFVGWHFLYEGLTKILMPNWTSAGYLMESHWLFSGFFHWLANDPQVLAVVDVFNIVALTAIGVALFFGIFTRPASIAGALLLALYYVANPPFIGFMGEASGEGRYLIVNKVLIEIAVLVLFAAVPKTMYFGIDRLVSRVRRHRDAATASDAQIEPTGRREFIKDLATVPLFGGFLYGLLRKQQWESFEERHLISQPSRVDATTGASPTGVSFKGLSELKSPVAKGRIGDLEISRLICGGNLISGYAHARDLIYVSHLVTSYFSDEKVMETMKLCEACGINTIILRVDNDTLRILEKYRRRGGKIQWICQAKITEEDLRSDIDCAIDSGADAVYVHGGVGDKMISNQRVDLLCESVSYIKERGVLAGLAGHSLEVPMTCEKEGADPDFYMKTLNSGNYWTAGPQLPKPENWQPAPHQIVEPEYMGNDNDNIWSVTPQQTIEFMKKLDKPWIAYKVLGAGAIPPQDGFKYAFDNGADFICVGMFDFQVVDDANIVNEVLGNIQQRERRWLT